MSIEVINLFIVDNNNLSVKGLRGYLTGRYGNNVAISSFYSCNSVLKKVDKDTNIIILTQNLTGENVRDVANSIKKINSKTKVIIFTNNVETGIAIDDYKIETSNQELKLKFAKQKISTAISTLFTYPFHYLNKELRVSKLFSLILITLAGIGIVLYFTAV